MEPPTCPHLSSPPAINCRLSRKKVRANISHPSRLPEAGDEFRPGAPNGIRNSSLVPGEGHGPNAPQRAKPIRTSCAAVPTIYGKGQAPEMPPCQRVLTPGIDEEPRSVYRRKHQMRCVGLVFHYSPADPSPGLEEGGRVRKPAVHPISSKHQALDSLVQF
jgi:hypothetical protein